MKNHKILTVFLTFFIFVGVSLLFIDELILRGGTYLANTLQDDFQVRLSKVNTEVFSLKTTLAVSVTDKKTGQRIVDVSEITFDVNVQIPFPVLDITAKDIGVDVTKEIVMRQRASGEKKDEESDFLSYLGTIDLSDIDLSFTDGERSMFTTLNSVVLNFIGGSGSVNGISAYLENKNQRFFQLRDLALTFQTEGITGKESAKLGVKADGARIRLSRNVIRTLSELLKFPEEESDSGRPYLKELSFIQLNDTRVTHKDLKLAAFIGKTTFDPNGEKSIIADLRADWTHTKRKLVSISKVSTRFQREDLLSGEKPELRMIVTGLRAEVGKELRQLRGKSKESKKPPELPFTISRLLIGNSSVTFPDVPGLSGKKDFVVREIFGNLRNLSLEPGTPLARFNFNATFEGESRLMADGRLDLAHSPPQASMDFKLFGFDMTKLNPELRKRIPVTFKEGEFNILGEIIKRDENIVGYFKPFLEDASYLGNKKEFKNTRHFFAEIGATIANWLFENKRTETVATRVPFTVKDGKVDFEVGEAIWSAIEHGVFETDRVRTGGDRYQLKQAQEEDNPAEKSQ